MSDDRDPLAPCTDRHCVLRIEPSAGMGTNGGCMCLDGSHRDVRRLARRLADERRRMAETLRAADALAARVDRMRAELLEHLGDGCAGPDGNYRSYACADCRRARQLREDVAAYRATRTR